jgi:fructoselysine and glucoselysine-specific PTS system IIB component
LIKLLRVDYRLVHGQVAISWSRAIGADCILVANDEVAGDQMRQSMLRLSKPQGMKLVIKSIEDSIKALKSGVTDKYKLLVVVNCINDAERLLKGFSQIKEVNLGVMPSNENTKAISKAINVTKEDTECMKRLLHNNIKLYIQQVPTESVTVVTEKLINIFE